MLLLALLCLPGVTEEPAEPDEDGSVTVIVISLGVELALPINRWV